MIRSTLQTPAPSRTQTALATALRVALGAGLALAAAHQLSRGRERKRTDDRLATMEALIAELKQLHARADEPGGT